MKKNYALNMVDYTMGYKDNHKSEYVSDIISNEAIRNMHEIERLYAHEI